MKKIIKPLGRFRLDELETQDVNGLFKLAKTLTRDDDSRVLVMENNYLVWESKDANRTIYFKLTYSLKITPNGVEYSTY